MVFGETVNEPLSLRNWQRYNRCGSKSSCPRRLWPGVTITTLARWSQYTNNKTQVNVLRHFVQHLLWYVSDVDECTASILVCHASTQCVNTLGSFKCLCTVGFTGRLVFEPGRWRICNAHLSIVEPNGICLCFGYLFCSVKADESVIKVYISVLCCKGLESTTKRIQRHNKLWIL